jgi:hypothetical protein
MSNRPSLRARWLPAVKRTRLVGPSCRRMLTEIGEHHMTEAGRAAVTQERLAATLGLSVVRVKHLFREARTARFLDLVQTGYRGYPTIHHAMIPAAARTEDRLDRRSTPDPLSRARKGVDTRPPTARVKERKTPTTPAPLRESRVEQSGGAPPPAPPGSASGGRADEEQDSAFLIIAPRAERGAQGSGGRGAPRLPKPHARPDPDHDGGRAGEGVRGEGTRFRPPPTTATFRARACPGAGRAAAVDRQEGARGRGGPAPGSASNRLRRCLLPPGPSDDPPPPHRPR